MEQQEEDRRKRLLAKRLEHARAGAQAYQKRKHGEAVKAFASYLAVLEEIKGVEPGGLRPNLFDIRTEFPELLVVSGVYWDLAKLYDRTESADAQALFRQYLDRFILFAKGMPHQVLCGETLRKYLGNDKPRHRSEFRRAYREITGASCFIATSLVDTLGLEEIERLRLFRDKRLAPHVWGRALIRVYGWLGPKIANRVDHWPEPARRALAATLRVAGNASAY